MEQTNQTIYVPISAECPKFGVDKKNTLKKGPNQLLLLLLSISNRNFYGEEGYCSVFEHQIDGRGWFDKLGNYRPANFKGYSELGEILGVPSETISNYFESLHKDRYIYVNMYDDCEKVYNIPDPDIYSNIDRDLIVEFYKYCKDCDVEATLRILSIIAYAFSAGVGLESDGSFIMTYEEACENINRTSCCFTMKDYYSCIGLLKALGLIECELIKEVDPYSPATHFKAKITKVCCQLLPGRSIAVAGAYAKSEVESMIQNAAGAPEN